MLTKGITKWGIRDAREIEQWNPRLRFLEQSSVGALYKRHCQLEQSEGDFRRFASAIHQVAWPYEAYVVRRTSTRPQVDSAMKRGETTRITWAGTETTNSWYHADRG